jgi:hypothetical protein
VNMKTLRQRCERLLREVEVPEPFDVHAFADTISHRRGRPLHLVAEPSPLGPCGMWLALPETDLVFYETATSWQPGARLSPSARTARVVEVARDLQRSDPRQLADVLAGLLAGDVHARRLAVVMAAEAGRGEVLAQAVGDEVPAVHRELARGHHLPATRTGLFGPLPRRRRPRRL